MVHPIDSIQGVFMSAIESEILKIQYDILKALDDKKSLTDKDVFQLENSYSETRFLKAFNVLISNLCIESSPVHHLLATEELIGVNLEYHLTQKGHNFFKHLNQKHAEFAT